MARFDKIVDLHWLDCGDLSLSVNGDIADTRTSDQYRAFTQRVITRLESNPFDWTLQPGVGAGIFETVGLRNSEATAKFLAQRIRAELTKENLLKSNEFTVEIIPLGPDVLGAFLTIVPPGSRQTLVLTFSYMLRDNKVIPRLLDGDKWPG